MKIRKVYEKNDYNDKNKSTPTSVYCTIYLYGGIVEEVLSFDTLELASEYKLNWINKFINPYDKAKQPTKEDVLNHFYEYYNFQCDKEELDEFITFDEELYKPIFFDLEEANEWFYDNHDDDELVIYEIEKNVTDVYVPDIIKIHRDTNNYNL